MQRGVSVLNSPALEFRGVSKRYRGEPALTDVRFTVARGEQVGLVGINGAGKSTLLRAALDLIDIDTGWIEIHGRDHRASAARAGVAYLPESFTPPHYCTGMEFVDHLCRLHGARVARSEVAAECDRLGLDPAVLDRRARHYSKGTAQKLGLAACLLVHPTLLLLDEPMTALDPPSRARVCTRLAVCGDSGQTLLFTSHQLDDVSALCGRVFVLNRGRLLFDGPPARFAASGALEGGLAAC